jgi:hypothetical protein
MTTAAAAGIGTEQEREQKGKEAVARMLSAEDILNADDVQYRTVPVPEWKGSVRVRTLSAEEVSDYVEAINGVQKRDSLAIMVFRSLVKQDGSQLFTDPDQLMPLKRRSMAAFIRLQDVILEMNGLGKVAAERAKNA